MATIAEKILSNRSVEKKKLGAGEITECEVDYLMVNDVTGVPAFEVFEELGMPMIREKVIVIADHYVPNKDVPSAEQAKRLRDYAIRYGIENYYWPGFGGVCHQVMIEEGFAAPGRLIVGADSHTCSYGALGAFSTGIGSTEAAAVMATGKLWFRVPETQRFIVEGEPGRYVSGKDIILHIIGDIGVSGSLYKAQEFYGSAIRSLSIADRITICNMAVEAGAKAGIIPPDDSTFEYLRGRVRGVYTPVYADEDAEYEDTFTYDASEIPPTVARPFLPENTIPARELDVAIDQAYLGSCTNGRIEDLRVAASILRGRKVSRDVRMIIVPASQKVYLQALKEGLIEVFLSAGAFVSGPTCGACLGGYMGVLGEGEVCVASTNRNFIGRMGHKDSLVYLASPAVVAASAIRGRITDPNDL
ncbi:MAG TPA: 3-isopropylmalate dehydratase large subunit [Candidatus Syntrophoarchaeum butanivorans]|uniref:3-isopropylmalate dehydratase large subunit n=1 Tax=Candidatus Syntropharchaeum butanivorans TaxID=1839936 RepID=A0A1F2P6E9_9EURY|nr:MAG: 3-isopropylmalate dehydratase large subunit [Candidatus Syntrophoarchaeum butanivorans]HEC57495.1 3-isopropylmalate dehydratase large subunit [Candidatus Syntrophoarchaeum butanivorans]